MNKNTLKEIGAIIAGFVTVFVLSVVTDIILESLHIFPPQNQPQLTVWWMLLLALVYRTGYNLIGGYVTASLSPKKSMKYVVILGIIGTFVATAGMLANLDKGNIWYPLFLALFSFPSVWLGGKLKIK